MKYQAIIFDMDGTIVDTNHIWGIAVRNILETRGIILDPAKHKEMEQHLTGLALIESCRVLKEIAGLDEPVEDLIREKSATACRLFKDQVRFIDGFTDFHKTTQNHNLKTGLATNADDETFNLTKQQLALHTYFGDHMYNISHVQNRFKPDPAIYIHTAQKLGIDPKKCVAIEDSAHGVTAARVAGMFCIGINTSKNLEQLRDAHIIIDQFSDINLEKLLQE